MKQRGSGSACLLDHNGVEDDSIQAYAVSREQSVTGICSQPEDATLQMQKVAGNG